jgi:hypothetical protein
VKRATPSESRARSEAEQYLRTAAVGELWQWANAPDRESDRVAECVRILLGECARLADLVPAYERLRADAAFMRGAVNAFRGENARLRRLLAGEDDG